MTPARKLSVRKWGEILGIIISAGIVTSTAWGITFETLLKPKIRMEILLEIDKNNAPIFDKLNSIIAKIDELDEKVDAFGDKVGVTREEVANLKGKIEK